MGEYGCVFLVSIGGWSRVGVEVGVGRKTCLGFCNIEKRLAISNC